MAVHIFVFLYFYTVTRTVKHLFSLIHVSTWHETSTNQLKFLNISTSEKKMIQQTATQADQINNLDVIRYNPD